MFKVTITENRVNNGRPNTYRETIVARNEEHLELIRRTARENRTKGGSQIIRVKAL